MLMKTLSLAVVMVVFGVAGCAAEKQVSATAPAPTMSSTTKKIDIHKPKNDYNITINYELGMHCTGFDFTYCCVLPPYNSVQSQVIKTSTGKKKFPELLEADDDGEPDVLVDGHKKFKLNYGFVGNTYSEGAKLHYFHVPYDVNGDGHYGPDENVANAYFTHLYVYKDLKGSNPKHTSKDSEKLFVGLQIKIPQDNGPAGAVEPSPIKGGHLYYTGKTGTVVFTKSNVLDNVPIVLTNPGIWDALGLPLTPFDDAQAGNPLTLTEPDVRPFQEAWVEMVDAKSGKPVIDSHSGKPVRFIGTEPIDVPNCSRCHANKTANGKKYNLYKREKAFWKGLGASDWIAGLKATSISIMQIHDDKNGTHFLKNYKPESRNMGNRLGRDPVLCQKCHADNVIAVLQSGTHKDKHGKTVRISSLTGALHRVHLKDQPLPDSHNRTGACAACHPAHRQDGDMSNFPITLQGKNPLAKGDNRDGIGCFAGRDVHSNLNKDKDLDGVSHLNAIGQWLQDNVSQIGGRHKGGKGLWCTNCHNQLARELYQRDNLKNAFLQTGTTIRNESLKDIARALKVSMKDLEDKYMDPKVVLDRKGHDTPGKSGVLLTWSKTRMTPDIAVIALKGKGPLVHKDVDGDVNVSILSANPAVDIASLKLPKGATGAVAVPYTAASDGGDYWLSAGVPHCADCHAAPFVEGQGGVAFPINQPGKYSEMRYSKGHSGLSCQACHQSIHGLYPVDPRADTTTYKQAPQYNPDGSHGPIKCAACHEVNNSGVPFIANKKKIKWKGKSIMHDFDAAVSWMHASAKDEGGAIPSEDDDDDSDD